MTRRNLSFTTCGTSVWVKENVPTFCVFALTRRNIPERTRYILIKTIIKNANILIAKVLVVTVIQPKK